MARLYIVEDESIVRVYIEAFLQKHHHEVVGSSGDFRQALEEIVALGPDLVISDIILLDKGGDGITLAQQVNEHAWVPFVFLSAVPFSSRDERLFSIPVYGYITKPVDEQKLVSTVEIALWQIHAQKQLEVLTTRLQQEKEQREEKEKALEEAVGKYESFLRLLSDVVFDLDAEGRIVAINQAIEHFLGYTPEMLMGKPFLDLISEDFLFFSRELLHLFQEDIVAQRLFSERVYEISFRHRDGGLRWGRVSVVPWVTASGILIGAKGIVYDITFEKKQQQRLENQLYKLQQNRHYQTFFRYILERMNQEIDPFPLFPRLLDFLRSSFSLDGVLLFRFEERGENRVLRRLFCSCDHTRPCKKLLEIEGIEDPLERMIYWWKRSQVPERFRFYWDEENLTRVILLPLRLEEKLLGIMACFWQTKTIPDRFLLNTLQMCAHVFAQAIRRHEDWERYQASQKALTEEKLRARKAEEMIHFGQMMSAIAHEVRQPLQSIRILSESPLYWFRQGKAIEYEKLLSNMEKISHRVERIDSIIQGMRQAALSVSTIQPQKVHLHAMIDEVLETLQQEIAQAEVVVEKVLSPLDIVIVFHATQLVQVLTNLMTNALRVLARQPQPRRMRIETERRNERVFARVIDNGPGIPPGREPYIFEPFFTTQPGVGMGIGLYVVKRLLQLYDASITYKREGGETVFEMVFPYQPEEKIFS